MAGTATVLFRCDLGREKFCLVSFYVSKKNGGRGKCKKNGERKVTLELFVDGEKNGCWNFY